MDNDNIDAYSMTLTHDDLLALIRNLGGLPNFEPAEITLTILDDESLNIIVTKKVPE